MKLRPSEIYYSQDSISNTFDIRSDHPGTMIGETLDELCDGITDIDEIPTISVADVDGKWFTADNRRLWVFRKLEALGRCRKIPVDEVYDIPSSKMTTENGGVDIDVRGSPGGHWIRQLDDSDTSSEDESSDDDDICDATPIATTMMSCKSNAASESNAFMTKIGQIIIKK